MHPTQKLDLSALEKAIAQLELSLAYYHSKLAKQDPGIAIQFRAAAIQGFEFTHEVACKMIKRYLNIALPSSNQTGELSFPNFIRTACEYGLLKGDLRQWKDYREQRNATSHTYNPKKAEEIFKAIPTFLEEVNYLLARLKERDLSL